MPLEGRRGAPVRALIFGVLAATPLANPGRILETVNPVSEALCGRGQGERARLAGLLGESSSTPLPAAWMEMNREEFQRWRGAPICDHASDQETGRFRSRHLSLEQVGRRLDDALRIEPVVATLSRFRGWHWSAKVWPDGTVCQACAGLRAAAEKVADIASRWRDGTASTVGASLEQAARREALTLELCQARPSPTARAELGKELLYFSWTEDGARALEVSDLLARPEVLAGCGAR